MKVIPLAGILEKDIASVVKEFAKSFKNKSTIQKPMWATGQGCPVVKPKSLDTAMVKEPEPVRKVEVCPKQETVAMLVGFCGKGFNPVSVRHNFCSGKCLDTAKKRRQRQARAEAGKCPQCGKPMQETAADI